MPHEEEAEVPSEDEVEEDKASIEPQLNVTSVTNLVIISMSVRPGTRRQILQN